MMDLLFVCCSAVMAVSIIMINWLVYGFGRRHDDRREIGYVVNKQLKLASPSVGVSRDGRCIRKLRTSILQVDHDGNLERC